MSLMDEMKNVVDTGRELFSTVSGKMKAIDDKVDAAVEGVPAEILNKMGRTVYVDQINGSDSNSGKSSSSPFKTFQRVGDTTPAGAAVEIRLMGNYEFTSEDVARFTGAQVFIRSNDPDVDSRIKFYGEIKSGYYSASGFTVYRNTLLNFFRIIIELPDIPAGTGVTGDGSAIIKTHSVADVPSPLFLRFAQVEFAVPNAENNPFVICPGSGPVSISSNTVTAPQAWINKGGIMNRLPSSDQIVTAKLITEQTALIPAQ